MSSSYETIGGQESQPLNNCAVPPRRRLRLSAVAALVGLALLFILSVVTISKEWRTHADAVLEAADDASYEESKYDQNVPLEQAGKKDILKQAKKGLKR